MTSHIRTAAGILLTSAAALFMPETLNAQTPPTAPQVRQADCASDVCLAYIRSGNTASDATSEAGLINLANALTARTSVEPQSVVGLNIESDELGYYPFIYWHVESSGRALSMRAREKLQTYMDNGGMVLFDIQSGGRANGLRAQLAQMLRPLETINADHTLARAFYLVSGLNEGSGQMGIWVEQAEEGNREDITPVIIDNRNWAAQWAGQTNAADTEAYEMGIRAGINMVIFALSGDYKADQSHVQTILERLDKNAP